MFIPYGRQSINKQDIRQVVKVLESDWITQGPKVSEFEKELCRYTGAKYAVAVSSGTAALHIAALAGGIKRDDEVITSPVTFVASANCILYCAAKPVFADIDPDTLNIDPAEVLKKINKKTRAIIPVHFAGYPCDLKEIHDIAKKNRLLVIEDAAHALGSQYRGVKIGSCKYSDMTIFSFHPVKAITTGEGGAVMTNRRDLFEKLLMLRSHGITRDKAKFKNSFLKSQGDWYYEMQELGFNYRLTDLQCSLGISQLKKIGFFIKKRREIADIYKNELSNVAEISLPKKEAPDVLSSWHLYCVRVKDASGRKSLFTNLRKSGIGVQVHYLPVYLHPYYRKTAGYKPGLCPLAERYYSQAISLPLHPGLSKKEIGYIIKTLKKLLK